MKLSFGFLTLLFAVANIVWWGLYFSDLGRVL